MRGKLGMQQAKKKPGSSIVVRLDGSEDPQVLVEMAGHDVPTHNGQLIDDERIAVNDSTGNTLRVFSVADGRELQSSRSTAPGCAAWSRCPTTTSCSARRRPRS